MADPVALLNIINVNSDINKTLSAIFSPSAAAVMPFKVHLSRCFVTFGRQISNSHLQTCCQQASLDLALQMKATASVSQDVLPFRANVFFSLF